MEEEILAKLELSDQQKDQVAEFRAKLAEMDEEFRELSRDGDTSEIAKRGEEINREVRENMQRILTEDQYQKYVRLWDEALGVRIGPRGAATSPRRPGGAAVAKPAEPEG